MRHRRRLKITSIALNFAVIACSNRCGLLPRQLLHSTIPSTAHTADPWTGLRFLIMFLPFESRSCAIAARLMHAVSSARKSAFLSVISYSLVLTGLCPTRMSPVSEWIAISSSNRFASANVQICRRKTECTRRKFVAQLRGQHTLRVAGCDPCDHYSRRVRASHLVAASGVT
jgi:hypothetical protein